MCLQSEIDRVAKILLDYGYIEPDNTEITKEGCEYLAEKIVLAGVGTKKRFKTEPLHPFTKLTKIVPKKYKETK